MANRLIWEVVSVLTAVVGTAVTVYQAFVPPAAEKAQAEIVLRIVSELGAAGVNVQPVQDHLKAGQINEAVDAAVKLSVAQPAVQPPPPAPAAAPTTLQTLPEQDVPFELATTDGVVQLTPFKVPVALTRLAKSNAKLTINGERTTVYLAEPIAFPAPAEKCTFTLVATDHPNPSTEVAEGKIKYYVQCENQ